MSALISLPPAASANASPQAPGLAIAAAPGTENAATGTESQGFAALFHKIAAKHAAQEARPELLMGLDSATPPEELAAVLPFLEGMGLIALATPATGIDGLDGDLAGELAAISAALRQASGKGADTGTPLATASASNEADEGIAVLPLPTFARGVGLGGDKAGAEELSAGKGFAAVTQAALDKLANTPANSQALTAVSNATLPGGHTSAPGGPALPVAHPVSSPGWGQEVGNRIVWMANRNESQAELVLTPPQMGRVTVSLSVTGDQATASFVSASPAVREALEAALPRLREILAEAGIQLGQAQVGAEHPGQSDRQTASGKASFAKTPEGMASSGEISSGEMPSALKSGRGLVDVFA